MRIEHRLSLNLKRNGPLNVLVVGAGGTGSAIVMGLPYLDQAMRVWGHPYGLHVTLMDADVVSETNCVRQPFSVSDIGMNKATVLINRINLFWGTPWNALAVEFHERSLMGQARGPDVVISCVDTRAARKAIAIAVTNFHCQNSYWLDLGNNAASGQFVLGQPQNAVNRRKADRLRIISELYPEVVDTTIAEDDLPSCSAIEALEKQEPFINQTLAASALAMLAQMLRYESLQHHGAFFNAKTGHMCALPVDPQMWRKVRSRAMKSQRSK